MILGLILLDMGHQGDGPPGQCMIQPDARLEADLAIHAHSDMLIKDLNLSAASASASKQQPAHCQSVDCAQQGLAPSTGFFTCLLGFRCLLAFWSFCLDPFCSLAGLDRSCSLIGLELGLLALGLLFGSVTLTC